jgi:hypothetical protein
MLFIIDPPRSTSVQRRETAQEMRRALISARVLVQVQLVVCLGVPPLARGQHFGYDEALPPLLVHLLCDLLRLLLLLRIVIEDTTPVLRPGIRTLSIRRRRVVHLIEELEDGAVCELLGVVDDLQGFGVCRSAPSAPAHPLQFTALHSLAI